MQIVLEPQQDGRGMITFPLFREELKEIKPLLPDYYYRTLEGFLETIEAKITKPLLEAADLEQEFVKLLPSFSYLRLALNSYIAHILLEHPEVVQKLLKDGLRDLQDAVERQQMLDTWTKETLLGVLNITAHSLEDTLLFPDLFKNVDAVTVSRLYQHAVALEMCLYAILPPVVGDVEAPWTGNIPVLVGWAKSYAVQYLGQLSELIKAQLQRPENAKLRAKFYEKAVTTFIGSGPRGAYEALLEERRRERELENG